MRYLIQKNLIILYLLFLTLIIVSHGFDAHTLIQLANGSQKTIQNVCLQALHNKIGVTSYDISCAFHINKYVKIGKRSKSNCYIRLGFADQYNESDDIICTPTQEFYLSINNSWVPAYMLKEGDALLTKDMVTKLVRHKEFIPRPLKMYMIEIEDSHTFFVGKHAILTHNIFLPGITLGFTIPFGSVATGAAGSFFGPIGFIGGMVLGGVASIAVKAIYENRIQRYKIPKYNISNIQYYCSNIIPHQKVHPKPIGCFMAQDEIDITCTYPIENPLETPIGCIEIRINDSNKITHNSIS